ncbi:type II secretion system GspH family protein [Rhodoblastus acidophilus]|uniref:Type II secretion system GspH family protein n=1 Tax=Candidatus Rhodoblastus alkanivorans TaxID=2954117 RepID=A0ABS9ZAS4_9HYPH|nr:type II secretion system protein [Candidatus Rhodoblastus alkanivorans]MCI4677163.1 type II secretion system GspH family protein [Candidatus Rhodoblastus alkanivorans]MCI4684516.1 type II secretion system GspH family protein [Candidatus Rhodoblastus alkanivorans]MDI4641837.1 type II secretion system GspH family protein [Rhodoblastus acidophilus]
MRAGLGRRRGFTLIETLAAFAIMALALGQLLRAIGVGAQSERRADFLLRATADARSQLAELGVSEPLAPGETSSRYDDGLSWTLDVARDRVVASPGGAPLMTAYRLRLDVRSFAGGGEHLTFVAEKLSVPKPEGDLP